MGKKAVEVMNITTRQITTYPSLRHCAVALDVSYGAIKGRAHDSALRLLGGQFLIRFQNSKLKWDSYQPECQSHPNAIHILVRNKLTEKVMEFYGYKEAEKELGLGHNTIGTRITNRDLSPIHGIFQVKRASDPDGWELKKGKTTLPLNRYRKMIPLQVRNVFTGQIRQYRSVNEWAAASNIREKTAYRYSMLPNQPIVQGKFQVKYLTDLTPWRIPTAGEKEQLLRKACRKVALRDIKKDTVTVFPTITACAKELGVSKSTVTLLLRQGDQDALFGRYQLQFADNLQPWIAPSEEKGQRGLRNLRPVVVRFDQQGEGHEVFYSSVRECAYALKINEMLLRQRLLYSKSIPDRQIRVEFTDTLTVPPQPVELPTTVIRTVRRWLHQLID